MTGILITGASGMLGRGLMRELDCSRLEAKGIGRRTPLRTALHDALQASGII